MVGVVGVGATGAGTIASVASESLVEKPIEFVPVVSTRINFSASFAVVTYVADVAPEIVEHVVSSN